jgi:hypothetical protein
MWLHTENHPLDLPYSKPQCPRKRNQGYQVIKIIMLIEKISLEMYWIFFFLDSNKEEEG